MSHPKQERKLSCLVRLLAVPQSGRGLLLRLVVVLLGAILLVVQPEQVEPLLRTCASFWKWLNPNPAEFLLHSLPPTVR